MKNKLTNRLRGITHDYSELVSPICEEAAVKIELLEKLLVNALFYLDYTVPSQDYLIKEIGKVLD